MEDIQYIVNEDGEKVSAILTLNDFLQTKNFLDHCLINSLCPIFFKLLEVPEDAIKFLNLLSKFKSYNSNLEITLKDEMLIKNKKLTEKSVKNYRSILKKFMEEKTVSIIDVDYSSSVKGSGTTYKLNFIDSLNLAVKDFNENRNLTFKEVIEIITYLEINGVLALDEKNNNLVEELLSYVKKQLSSLRTAPKILDETGQYVIPK